MPFEAFIGRPARLPIDLILPTPERKYETQTEYIRDTMVRFEKMYTWIKGRSEARFRRNAKSYTGNKEQFKEGDKIWCSTPHKLEGKSGKITYAWLGPYTIIKILSDVMLEVMPSTTEGRAITIHRAKV